ncbi:hypothetical protein BKA70DRAFT_1075577, partial [Coprinopsis sp. MPI-PUGE-AT-0042]
DPLFFLGQRFARIVDPFAVIKTVIKCEMMAIRRLEKRSETWRQGMHYAEERRDHRTYLALQQLLQLQGEDLAKSSVAVQKHIVYLVSAGQAKAWSTDLAKAQALLTQRLGGDCFGQGFDNDTIGRLLCPITHDWSSDEDRQSIRETPQKISAGSWPTVFYQNMEFKSQRPWEGLLRNSLLV